MKITLEIEDKDLKKFLKLIANSDLDIKSIGEKEVIKDTQIIQVTGPSNAGYEPAPWWTDPNKKPIVWCENNSATGVSNVSCQG